MTPEQVLVLLLIAAWTAIGGAIGHKKGRTWLGITLGLLLGIIGIIIMAFLSPTHDEMVRRERERIAILNEARR